MGSSASSTPSSSGSSSKSSGSSKSFGTVDPRKQFFFDIKSQCQKHDFPAWDRLYDFDVYPTAKKAFGHAYIAICCQESALQNEYLCIHLKVDDQEKIHPEAKFKPKQVAQDHVVDNKNSQKYKIKQISMRQFTKLALDLIAHHGKYCEVSNNCQTFAASFVSKLQSYSDALFNIALYGTPCPTVYQTVGVETPETDNVYEALASAAAKTAASCAVTAVAVAAASAVTASAAAGALLSVPFSGVAVAAPMSIAAKSAGNEYSKIESVAKAKTEMEWMNWEHEICNL